MPVSVVGVTETADDLFASTTLRVWMPYSTVNLKLLGNITYKQLSVELKEGSSSRLAQKSMEERIAALHGQKDFSVQNIDVFKRKAEKTTGLLKALLSVIAFISLLVGGIGVMNIMLVSVTERTKEIGLRIAVGARQSDILQQFLIEAAMVCFVGGMIGVILSVVITTLTGFLYPSLDMGGIPFGTVGLALLCSTLIGIAFGFFPAKRAAHLNPIDALSRE
jgi:macrolide transport system ATP-binding/permease protein